uniref:LITAF domain-containing protein n=1 Tax=Lygus hesperus TaxID=30085 RepID=A0A0K8SWF9_LYGHE
MEYPKQQYQKPPPYDPPPNSLMWEAQPYPPYQQQSSTAPTVAMVFFGQEPQSMTCPNCRTAIMTRTESKATIMTHVIALVLLIVFCPCVCLPYCCDSCQATYHYCPKCGHLVGTANT